MSEREIDWGAFRTQLAKALDNAITTPLARLTSQVEQLAERMAALEARAVAKTGGVEAVSDTGQVTARGTEGRP